MIIQMDSTPSLSIDQHTIASTEATGAGTYGGSECGPTVRSGPLREDIILPFVVTDDDNATPPSYTASSALLSQPKMAANSLFSDSAANASDRGRSSLYLAESNDNNANTRSRGYYAAPYPVASPFAAYDTDTPACFSRGVHSQLTYPHFDSIYLVSKGKQLEKGFPLAAPPLDSHANHMLEVHPFISHDVTETDWIMFIHAIQITSSLNERDKKRSHPMIISAVPIVNSMTTYGIQQYMKGQKGKKVLALIEMWNRHFFGPRKIRIAILRGREILTTWNTVDLAVSIPAIPKDQLYRLFVISLSEA